MAEATSGAEVELKTSEGHAQRQLNLSTAATVAVSIVFLLVAMNIGPSATDSDGDAASFSGDWWDTPLQMRHTMDLPMDTLRAQLPVNGTYEALPYEEHFVEVELPASEQDAGFPGPALMHVALWLPAPPFWCWRSFRRVPLVFMGVRSIPNHASPLPNSRSGVGVGVVTVDINGLAERSR